LQFGLQFREFLRIRGLLRLAGLRLQVFDLLGLRLDFRCLRFDFLLGVAQFFPGLLRLLHRFQQLIFSLPTIAAAFLRGLRETFFQLIFDKFHGGGGFLHFFRAVSGIRHDFLHLLLQFSEFA